MEKKRDKLKRARLGIQIKLLGILIPMSALVIGVLIALISSKSSGIVLAQSEKLLDSTTQSVTNKIEAWMKENITALDWERDAISYFDLREDEELLPYLKHTANRYDAFPAGIYIATTDGELKHASFVPGPEYDVFAKSWYQEGLESEPFVFGSVYFDEDSQSYVVGASGILKDQAGGVRGVAAADIYLSAISDIVKEVTLEQTGAMFLVDRKTNTVIGHKDAEIVGTVLTDNKDPMYQEAEKLIRENKTGITEYTDPQQKEIYLDIMPVPDSSWVTVAYVPRTEVLASLNELSVQMTGIAVLGVLLLAGMMFILIHIIVKPVKKMTGAIVTVADGNFSNDIKIRSSDEIGVMASALGDFIVRMRGMITQLKQSANQLNGRAANSGRLSGNLQEVSEKQSESMEELNRTVDELARSISEVAESVSSLSMLVSNTAQEGEAAGGKMKETVEASDRGRQDMLEINTSMDNINSKIHVLDTSVKQVGSSITEINAIVELIRDIAEETTLLSLNASIEAARAGEMGRGFAVVADQIGKLATTSKTAVDNIAGLTENISRLVEKTVEETDESVKAISQSADVVRKTEETFGRIFETVKAAEDAVSGIMDKIHQVNDVAVSVAAITQEQSAAAEEILATAEGMNSSSKDVMDNSREVASDAKELGREAEILEELMGNFTV